MRDQDSVQGIEELQGRFFFSQKHHQPPVDPSVVSKKKDHCQHHNNRGQHERQKGQETEPALSGKMIMDLNPCDP